MNSLRRKVIINILEDNHLKTIEFDNYKLLELQKRIDKAIEYIKMPIVYETNKIEDLENSNATRNQELLSILKGEDK